MKVVIAALLLLAAVSAERFFYDGYKVYDLYPSSIEDVDFLHDLMIKDDNLDFWEEPNRLGGKVTVMVPPEYQSIFLGFVQAENIVMSVRQEDVAENLREFWADYDTRRSQRSPSVMVDFDDYNTLEEIEAWMESLPAGACADAGLYCELNDIGTTSEGRQILSLRVASSETENKPSFWLDSTIHAREWIAPATTIRVLNHLISEYGTDQTVTSLMDTYDWFFVPVFNPDGYKYTETSRYWRKNRSVVSSTCFGVDLNRNHDYNWGEEGVSHSPCSDLYCGASGASELETQAIQNEILRVEALGGIQVLMTFHSYGYMWMHPWGNTVGFTGGTCERASDHDDMYALAEVAATAIADTHGTRWSYGTSCEVIYETTGGTDDWAKGVAGVKYTICPELRGVDFVAQPTQIKPSFEEIWSGLVAQEAALSAMKK